MSIRFPNRKSVIHQPVNFNLLDDEKTTMTKRMQELERKLKLNGLSKEEKAELEEIKTQLRKQNEEESAKSIYIKLDEAEKVNVSSAAQDKVCAKLRSVFNVPQEE